MAGGLRAAIDEVLALDVSALSDAAVRAEFFEIATCAELLELARCRFAAALDGRGIPDADGAASTASWIQVETGQVRREADAALRLGRSLDAHPAVEAAWAAGEITASAARMIVQGRRVGAESAYAAIEPTLVGFAVRREFRSLRQAICYYRNHASADHAPAEPEGLFLSLVRDSYVVSGTLDRYTGEMLSRAIDAATMPPACDDHRTPAQRRSEALGVVAKTFCDLGCGGAEHSNQAHVLVHVDWASLAAGTPFATMGRDGQPINREVLDRVLCESSVSRIVTGPHGEVLDVGRARRTPTRAQRMAVIARDRHCRFAGCDRPAGWSEIHHVHAWQHGGPTDLHNLVLLCGHHHRVVHRPGWTVKFDGSEFTVITPEGHERTTRPPGRPAGRPPDPPTAPA